MSEDGELIMFEGPVVDDAPVETEAPATEPTPTAEATKAPPEGTVTEGELDMGQDLVAEEPVAEEPAVEETGDEVAEAAPKKDATEGPSPEQFEEALKQVKRKVKVLGEEKEVSIEELEKGYELASASFKRMEDAANERKQVLAERDAILGDLKQLFGPTSPDVKADLLKRVGVDPVAFAEELLTHHLELQSMTPEQLQIVQQRQQLQAEQQRVAEERRRLQEEIAPIQRQHYMKQVGEIVDTALDQAGIPSSPDAQGRVAQEIARLKGPDDDITPEVALVAALVVKERMEQSTQSLKSAPLEQIKAMLGDDVLKALREDSVKQLGRTPVQAEAPEVAAEDGDDDYVDIADIQATVFRHLMG